jgi:hypothetical protein
VEKSELEKNAVVNCCCAKLVVVARRQVGNPEEEKLPSLKVITKQRLVEILSD